MRDLKPKDMRERDARAAHMAAKHGKHHAPPSEMYAFRRQYRLSVTRAAALLGYQATWWQWREDGYMLMAPADLDRAKRAAPAPAVAVQRLTVADRLTALESQLESMAARLALLERDRHGIL